MLASFMTTANLFRGLLCETKGLPIRSKGILISRTWKESFQLIVERQVDERWKLIRVYLAVQSSFRRNPGKSVLTNLKIGAACLHKISCFPFGWIELPKRWKTHAWAMSQQVSEFNPEKQKFVPTKTSELHLYTIYNSFYFTFSQYDSQEIIQPSQSIITKIYDKKFFLFVIAAKVASCSIISRLVHLTAII